ncbi:hypothetical protein IAU60_004848 [Kwoniella sp. DSM 27419]
MGGIAQVSLGGPGPQTLAYRLLRSIHAVPSLQSYTSNRSVHSSTSTCDARGPRSVRRQHQSEPSKAPRTSGARAAGAQSGVISRPTHDTPDVILLRPPPDYPIDDHVNRLERALESVSVETALPAWMHLRDLDAVSRLSDGTMVSTARFVRDALTGPPYRHLGKLATTKPADFGLIRDMAIESSARGHTIGLYTMMLRLIEAGRPKDVVDAFTACKARMREVQGKDQKDLVSWDRHARLAARLEGDGLKDLMMVNIAALTLLDQCNEHTLFKMLDSHVDLRPTSPFNFGPINRALRKVRGGGQDVYARFRSNVEKLVLSLLCYHPNAFVSRVTMLGASRSPGKLEQLYDKVLEGSVGPDAFLRPRDLSDFGHIYTNIPIPPIIWLSFIKVFEWRADVDRIARMIDKDLPERGLPPNAHLLSAAMLHMAIIVNRKNVPGHVRTKAREWIAEYWRRLTSKNWHLEDGPYSRRVRTLGVLSWQDHQLRGEIRRLYLAAKSGHLGRIGPKTRAAFVEFFMIEHRLQDAFKVFDTFPHDPDPAAEDDLDKAFSTFVRRLALGSWTAQEKLKYCNKALGIISAAGYHVRTHTLGPLLAIQLDGGLPMSKTVDAVLQATVRPDSPQAGLQRWTKVLFGLLSKWTHNHSPKASELDAGLLILRRASETELFGTTRGRLVSMWMSFLVPAVRSTVISTAERQEYIDSALELFPGGRAEVSIGMWMELIQRLFARPNGTGFAEGWRRWQEVLATKPIYSGWWDKMLAMLIEHKRHDFAIDMVRSAWADPSIERTEAFWLRAQAAGLTTRLGIEEELQGEQADAVARGQGRRPSYYEPLSLAYDLEEEEMDEDDEDAEGRWNVVEEDEEEGYMDR